jgi:hypothetical protein
VAWRSEFSLGTSVDVDLRSADDARALSVASWSFHGGIGTEEPPDPHAKLLEVRARLHAESGSERTPRLVDLDIHRYDTCP